MIAEARTGCQLPVHLLCQCHGKFIILKFYCSGQLLIIEWALAHLYISEEDYIAGKAKEAQRLQSPCTLLWEPAAYAAGTERPF